MERIRACWQARKCRPDRGWTRERSGPSAVGKEPDRQAAAPRLVVHDHDRSAPLHAGDVSQQRDRHSDWICACASPTGREMAAAAPTVSCSHSSSSSCPVSRRSKADPGGSVVTICAVTERPGTFYFLPEIGAGAQQGLTLGDAPMRRLNPQSQWPATRRRSNLLPALARGRRAGTGVHRWRAPMDLSRTGDDVLDAVRRSRRTTSAP